MEAPQPTCPLCAGSRIFRLRAYAFQALRKEWKAYFSFDPFLKFGPLGDELTQLKCATCDIEFFEPQLIGDASLYETLASTQPWYYEADQWEFREAISRLASRPELSSLIEVGCGQGFFLEKVSACYDAWGLELNEKAVSACMKKGLKVMRGDLGSLDRRFDAVLAFEVVEHLADPRGFLETAIRVLEPGGTLLFAVPNPDSYLGEFDHFLFDMPPHHATRWSKKTFEYLGSRYPIDLVGWADEPLRYVHYAKYVSMLSDNHYRFPGDALRQRLKRKVRDWLVTSFESLFVPLFYQYHRSILKGQTHLVEFKKKSPG